MKLEVVIVHSGWPKPGGVTVDVRGLVSGLILRGHEAVVAQDLRVLGRKLTSRPGALVHVFSCLPSPTIVGAMAAARAGSRALVWTPVFHPSRRRTWRGYGLRRVMELFDAIAPRAACIPDAVIAATEAEADYFRRVGARHVELIPPGVSEPSHAKNEHEVEDFRSRVGLNGGPTVLTVARDNSRKALPFGIESFRALRRRHPDAELLMVGAEADCWRREEGVRCTGWLDPGMVELAYRSADVLFVPSLYEGLPRAVIEAWSFALPVVATNRVALAPTIDAVGGQIVQYGNPGEAADALSSILADAHLARRYGNAGRELVQERFCLNRSVELTEALYRRLEK